jgi:hypothetical protein
MTSENAQRTLVLLCFRAADGHIDRYKNWCAWAFVGRASGGSDQHALAKLFYPHIDSADRVSCRPKFAGSIDPANCRSARRSGMRR